MTVKEEARILDLVVADPAEAPAIAQSQALQSLAKSMDVIATFVTQGGLTEVLQGYAKTNSVSTLLGGLTANAGRNGLDARFIQQNAIEITHVVEAVFDKYIQHMAEKTQRDPELKDAEKDFTDSFAKEE